MINIKQTLNEFFKNTISKNNSEIHNKTLQNINLKETKENESELIIDVIVLYLIFSFFRTNKIVIFIILGILLILGAVLLIVLLHIKNSQEVIILL